MSAYIHGSMALEERSNQAAKPGKQAKAAPNPVYRAKGLPTTEKLLYLFAVIVFCAVAGVIAFRYAAAFELNSQIIQVETDIRRLEEQNAILKNEIAKLQDPELLIDKGLQLGLAMPHDLPAIVSPSQGGTEVATSAAE